MNFQEIKAKIEEVAAKNIAEDEDIIDNYNGCDEDEYYKYMFAEEDLDESIFGKVIEVYSKGGSGQGESWNVVKHFIDHNVYISLDGYYSSYEGADFNQYDLKEVFPQEKTIVVYSEIK